MQSTSLPASFTVLWAANAGVSYTHAVPVPSQIGITNGAASFTDGFPPLCFSALNAGGVPPFGIDFNGILNAVTASIQVSQAGYVASYNSGFSGSIGGYPKNAILSMTGTVGGLWMSTVENNSSNPDTGGANWVAISNIHGSQLYSTSGGTGTWNLSFTVPTGVTSIVVEVIGGGSGGQGGTNASTGGYGGGGGGYARKRIAVTPGLVVSGTVGGGGVGGATGNNNGGPGVTSSFGAFVSATGGLATTVGNPGLGGVGVNGDVNYTGGAGGSNDLLISGMGGGAGGVGNTSASGTGPAQAGTTPGGGGGGGGATGTNAGGAGGQGQVFISW